MKIQKPCAARMRWTPKSYCGRATACSNRHTRHLTGFSASSAMTRRTSWSFCRPTGSTISSSDCKSGRKNRKTLTTKTENKQRRIFTQPSNPVYPT